MHVTLADAERAIEAARSAQGAWHRMCIAIVDSGANLKAFHRMDDAGRQHRHSHQESENAVFFGMPTGQIGKLSQPGARCLASNIQTMG